MRLEYKNIGISRTIVRLMGHLIKESVSENPGSSENILEHLVAINIVNSATVY